MPEDFHKVSFFVDVPATTTPQKMNMTIDFPLADGRDLVWGPLQYNEDGLATKHSAAFVSEPRFAEAYRRGVATNHPWGPGLHIEWRVYLPCWAASIATRLEGDFVECGVASGIVSAAVCYYVDFNKYPQKKFWLLDTFEGFPIEQVSDAELKAGIGRYATAYNNTYDEVAQTFKDYPNVVLIKGRVPETLSQVTAAKIAYLMLDMNAAAPERAAIETFWDRIVPGGMILFDDYGWAEHVEQKRVLDEFVASKGLEIFSVPSGQGLLVKPPGT
jgi:O-methyltransferase